MKGHGYEFENKLIIESCQSGILLPRILICKRAGRCKFGSKLPNFELKSKRGVYTPSYEVDKEVLK